MKRKNLLKGFIILFILVNIGVIAGRKGKVEVLKEAEFYKQLKHNFVKCELCPNYCVLKDGEVGLCRVRKNIGGKLYSLVYNQPVTIHIDPIEKKPLFHFYPNSYALSIATVGCNLRCIFCQNWEISQTDPRDVEPDVYTPSEIVDLTKKYKCKSISFTYTEPTVFYEYMLDIAKLAKKQGIKTTLITCGYINPEPLRKLASYIDAANVDLKGSEKFYQEYTTGKVQPVLESLKILDELGVWVEITNLVIPQANDDMDEIKKMCRWIKDNLGTSHPLHFSRFFPRYKLLNRPPTPLKTLIKAREIALEQGIKYVYIGNISTNAENTYCPHCGKLLIERKGYQIGEINIENNKCKFCGEEIEGVWK